MFKAEYIVT